MILDGKALADASLQDEMLETERARKQQEAMSQFTQMARQAAQEQAAQQAAQDPLNAIQRQIAFNLVGAKQAYNDALANGDTDGMAAAHGAADSFRSQGNAIGWNGDGYGQGVTLEQAAQNLANNDARALANIFYNQQNADDHYTMEIANLLDKGYSIDSAKRMAAQSADRLDRRNNAELIDSFATYGLDPRGVLTNNGVRILGELAQNGNSELANFYANMYAKPVQNWGFENSLITAANADRYARGRQMLSGEIQEQLAQNNWKRSEQTANNNVQRYLAQAEGMVGIKALDAQTQAAVRSNIIKPLMESNVVTPEMAASYVATGYLVPKGTNGKGTTSGMKPDSGMFKALMEHANNLISRAEEAEANGNKELAAQLMAEAEQYKQQANRYAAMSDSDGAGKSIANVDVNNYDALQAFAQDLVNENASRPENEQKTKAQIIDDFLFVAGRDNPYAIDIVNRWQWGDEGKAQEPAKQSESPRQSSNNNAGPASSSGGQQGGHGKGLGDWMNETGLVEVYSNDRKRKIGVVDRSQAGKYDTGYINGHMVFIEKAN